MTLEEQLNRQVLNNGYELVNGVAMHQANGDRFQIPHPVLKKYVGAGHFVELRIDSPRFSAHPGAEGNCTCSHCQEEATKPILRHEQPATLLPLPSQEVPSRGWGEDFWVQITIRSGRLLKARVDNPLCEHRLHGLHADDELVFHEDHILAVHASHRLELVEQMDHNELQELARWLHSQSG